jgi:regulator of protease activity HflC (stomatin/prohibitin superfamily)
MVWLIALTVLILVAFSIRKIAAGENGVVIRLGRVTNRVLRPGFVFIVPFIDRLVRVPAEPFLISLPPQSAITKDEIPIQLQASLRAEMRDAKQAALEDRDWRIRITSRLQDLMKDGLEELDFDRLDESFPDWIRSIREKLEENAKTFGVNVIDLQISNLSPRTKPSS